MRLYSGPMSLFGAKAQIAIAEKGLDFELIMVPFSMRRRYQPKHPEVVRVNPRAQVPVLIDGAVEVADSTQIFEYIEAAYPDPPLWPNGPAGVTRARQLEWTSDEVFFPWVAHLMNVADPVHPTRVEALYEIHAHRARLDQTLASGPYLAGSFSYADIAFVVADLFAEVLGADACAPDLFGHWRDRVRARPAVHAVLTPMIAYMGRHGLSVPTLPRVAPSAAAPTRHSLSPGLRASFDFGVATPLNPTPTTAS